MSVDVRAETTIARARDDVASYVVDPAHDPVWIGGIRSARLLGERPVAEGTRVAREARFLGRTIHYVNEVTALETGRRLEMRSVQAPFPMHITYEFEDAQPGTTTVRVRVQGDPKPMFKVAGPLMARMVRRSIQGDVERLRAVLEA